MENNNFSSSSNWGENPKHSHSNNEYKNTSSSSNSGSDAKQLVSDPRELNNFMKMVT